MCFSIYFFLRRTCLYLPFLYAVFSTVNFTQTLNELLAVGCSYITRVSLPINTTRVINS